MLFRQRITLIMMVIYFIIINDSTGLCTTSKKVHVLSGSKKISVKHSRTRGDQSTVGELQAKVGKLNVVDEVKKRVMVVEASAYTLSKKETDNTPNKTSVGERPVPGKTCAVSKDLKHLLHKNIYLPKFDKTLRVNDTMNKRYRKSIDIAYHSRKDALKFGRKDVTIVVLN